MRINGREWGDRGHRALGVELARGSLSQMLESYAEQPAAVRKACRVTIFGGFHLDGSEIDDLIEAGSWPE